MSNDLVTADQARELDLAQPQDMAKVFVASGYWPDVRAGSQAMVKIMAGREMGLPAFASLQNIDVVEGHLRLRSNLLATLVKQHPKYDYRVREWSDKVCKIEFFVVEDGERESIGFGEFTDADRERGGLALKTRKGYASVWGKYPKAMLFARAMSNGVAAHCPDVTGGARVYTEGDDFGTPTRMERPPSRTEELNAALEGDAPSIPESSPLGGGVEDGDEASPESEVTEEARDWFGEEGA